MKKERAAKRTLNLPGVDTKEQGDQSGPIARAPQVRRCVLRTYPPNTHLKDSEGRVLCGERAREMASETLGKVVCQACRVEASRLRAVVR